MTTAYIFAGKQSKINGSEIRDRWKVVLITQGARRGIHERWQGSGYSSKTYAVRRARWVAKLLGWQVVGRVQDLYI